MATTTRSRVSHASVMPWSSRYRWSDSSTRSATHSRASSRERAQVARAEVVGQGGVDALGRVDVAVGHAPAKGLGAHVDQLDLVGGADDGVRHGLALRDAGDALHHVVQGLEVLDVDGRDDVDAGVEQLVDVLPALGVAAARRVGVGQLVDQRHRRLAGEHGVEVHLLERGAAVLHRAPRDDREVAELARGARPAVGLDVADDHVRAAARGDATPRRAWRTSCRRLERRRGRRAGGRVP